MVTLNEKLEIVLGNALALASLDELHEQLGIKDVEATRMALRETLIVTSTMLVHDQFPKINSGDKAEAKLAEMMLQAINMSQAMVGQGLNIGDVMNGADNDSPESNS